jgi:23S rRNA pseudouridine1911/1915/1917 synthase
MPEGEGRLDSWLKEDKLGRVARARSGERGAKRAVTLWRLLREGPGISLLELSLETGRKHQIRVQLADAGHPVLGDRRYGKAQGAAASLDPGRLCLHAQAIELRLPGREPLRVESPAPPEFYAALDRAKKASVKPSAPRTAPPSGEARRKK